MSPTNDRDSAMTSHMGAVASYLDAARAVPDSAWERPMRDEKWSPAQVSEHLRLTYTQVQNELAGGSGLRIRSSWWLRTLLRWRMLPHILSRGQLPEGAKAPREIRPGNGPFDRDAVLDALQVAARATQDSIARGWDDPNRVMTHHVFGRLALPTAMRFLTVHTEHHARQLRAVPGSGD